MSHEKQLSQAESKWVVEKLREELALNLRDKLTFAHHTPTAVMEYLAEKFGVSVDLNWVTVAARR